MDLNTLSRLLKELILTHDRVSLPGMGSFMAELAPSVFSDRALVIHPPFRRLLFRTSEAWNDELLENLYAQEMKIDLLDAKGRIQSFLNSFKNELNSKKILIIPDFGTMKATDQNDYFFVAEKELFIYPDAYGLEPINVKILAKPGQIEELNYKVPKEKVPLSKTAKQSIAVFAVLFTVIAIIVLMVIFKNEIRPVWEWLLYNREERELLRQL